MISPKPKPHVAISKSGDVLIIQGPGGCPVLFFPQSQVPKLLDSPETATAVFISDVGAAAVETLLAGGATFEAWTVQCSETINSVTIRFELPNHLAVVYSNDDELFADRERLKAFNADLLVSDSSIDWVRKHTQFIGHVIGSVSTVPPQITGLQRFDAKALAALVREKL